MDYLFNSRNLVRDAELAATNVEPSNAITRTDEAAKSGGGQVALAGDYTGAADTTIDVEILDDAISGTPRISLPAFTGVGNGTMSGVAAEASVAAQEFVVTLEDLGTDTTAAYVPFQGVTLRARSTGEAGNAITVAVDASALVATATDFAVQGGLRAGTNEYIGDEFNFGAVTLGADGKFPLAPAAPRLRFGLDPVIYRPYRVYRDGQYVYGFSPAPVRDVPAGTRVYAVTGARTVTLTDGTDTDTLEDIVTLYDCLDAIRSDSTLVAVEGAIVNDRAPGGQGVTDLSVWTQPYVQSLQADGTDHVERAEIGLIAGPAAPTETLTIRCRDASTTGRETWEVHGDVSGLLASATTNAAYADGPYTFTIPLPEVDDSGSAGTITLEYLPLARGEGEQVPTLCVVRPRLGAAARNGSWLFELAAKPPADCDCTTGTLIGGPNDDCLGNTDPGDTTVSDASRLIRLQRLTAAVRESVRSNTDPTGTVSANDVAAVQASASILADCLRRMSASASLAPPAWQASHDYEADEVAGPTTANGYRYGISTPGTSGSTEPETWTTTTGGTVSDGTAVWTCLGKVPMGMWDDLFTAWQGDVDLLTEEGPLVAAEWVGNDLVTVGDLRVPPVRNGWIYRVLSTDAPDGIGMLDAEPDTWPTSQNSTTLQVRPRGEYDDTISAYRRMVWIAHLRYWRASMDAPVGLVSRPGNGRTYRTTVAGTTGTSEPTWATDGSEFTDGTAKWQEVAAYDLPMALQDVYLERYRTASNDVLAAAGIDPNFESASANGDGCWQDFDDNPNWWVYQGSETPPYLPVQTGHYYHSASLTHDEDGKPVANSTHEFGFGARFGCEDLLLLGDRLRVTIAGVPGGGNGYQQGDIFTASIARAVPLEMGGGQTGNDTLIWSVVGGEAGGLDDYALVKAAPAAYSDGGIGFLITPGGIAFALGDAFRFSVEGGTFQWRRDGGDWSDPEDIAASVVLADGLSATFTGGAAPSWVAGDRWSFLAEAVNGPEGIRQPTDARMSWTGSTVITVTPAGADTAADAIALLDHAIPSDATITLQGSDDGFATHTDVAIPWRAGSIRAAIDLDFPAYRVAIDKGGSLNWLFLGNRFQPALASGHAEIGKLTRNRRLPSATRRAGQGVEVTHEWMSQASAEALQDAIESACLLDDGRFGIVPHPALPDAAIVTVDGETVAYDDLKAWQPADPAQLRVGVKLTLSPIP